MKIIKFNKSLAACSAFFITASLASASATNASIKKDADFAVATSEDFLQEENAEPQAEAKKDSQATEKQDAEEKVAEADTEPEQAEVTENPEYKNKFGKIDDDKIMDSDSMPRIDDPEVKELEEKLAKENQKKEEEDKKIPEYSGSYGGSIRTIRPKKIEVTDGNAAVAEDKAPIAEETSDPAESTAEDTENTAEAIAEAEEASAEEQTPEPVPSRSVTMKNGQYLEVTYPGKGWSFIGDDGSKELLVFNGRRLTKEDTTYTLRSKKPGETLLHFYKIDLLTGQYIDDYLAVTVLDELAQGNERNEKVVAPLYAEYVPPRPDRTRAEEDAESEKAVAKADDGKPMENAKTAAVQSKPQSQKENSDAETSSQTSDKKVKTNIQTAKSAGQEEMKKPAAEKSALASTSGKKAESEKAVKAQAKPESKAGQEKAESERAETAKEEPSANEAEKAGIAKQENDKATPDAENGDLFERAKKAYAEKRYKDALDLAQAYLDISVNDTDEVLYLLGQIWEAESAVKNIKSSINSYDALVKNYPMSNLWRKANQRLVYLKRFYVDIR